MQLHDEGLEYWIIATRFHNNRQYKGMKIVASAEMQSLHQKTSSKAVKKAVQKFLQRHQPPSPRKPPNNDGPRFA